MSEEEEKKKSKFVTPGIFLAIYSFSFLCLVIVQSVSIVDVDLDIPLTCLHSWKRQTHVPMLLW
jgi:hypothetical protein